MPPKYKRCVAKVSSQKGTRSAHAICTAANAGDVRRARKREAKSRGKKRAR